jgi:hypothetical protein
LLFQFLLDARKRLELIAERRALLHQLRGLLGVVPNLGVFGEVVQLRQTLFGPVDVKATSSAARLTARFLRRLFEFRLA